MQIEEKDITTWKKDIQDYQFNRKQKKIEQEKVKRVTYQEIKANEQIFNPILQIYSNTELDQKNNAKATEKLQNTQNKMKKNVEKYQKDYDIITLEKIEGLKNKDIEKNKNVLLPSVREFNIITNQHLEEHFFKNVKVLKQPKPKENKVDHALHREFNIISNLYTQDHEKKQKEDIEKIQNIVKDKYDKTHDYNPILVKFYDQSKEENYQQTAKLEQQDHGKDANSKLPPSLKFRESVIFDPSKPVPEEIKMIDQQKKNARRRFELRYIIENEYHERDLETQERNKQRLQQRLHEGKYTEDYKKGFDIITLNPVNSSEKEKYIYKKKQGSPWDQVQNTKSQFGPGNIEGNNSELNTQRQNNFDQSLQSPQDQQQNQLMLSQQNNNQLQLMQTGEQIIQEQINNNQEIQPQSDAKRSLSEVKSAQDFYPSATTVDGYKKSMGLTCAPRSRIRLPKVDQPREQQLQNDEIDHQGPKYIMHGQPPSQHDDRKYNKQYLNDPENAILVVKDQKIFPKFVAPIKRIKTGGFITTSSIKNEE